MAQKTGLEFTNPDAYREKMDRLLGNREPISVISETPDVLDDIVGRHSPRDMRRRPFPGKWTPNEIIGHLADAEWVYGYRIRLVLCEDQPTILGMDQDLWVSGQRYNDREPADLLEMFRGLRSFNLPLWRQMAPSDFERAGKHNERGDESLGAMIRMLAGHDLSHIDQISRYLEAG
ncbi:MAG: DinB family protein [Phycisphaerales bacterium]|nr:MAG: DinB family protein [Phycisphaerales bacterium]